MENQRRGLRPCDRRSPINTDSLILFLMGAKRKFSDQNVQIAENQSGRCLPTTAILNSFRIATAMQCNRI